MYYRIIRIIVMCSLILSLLICVSTYSHKKQKTIQPGISVLKKLIRMRLLGEHQINTKTISIPSSDRYQGERGLLTLSVSVPAKETNKQSNQRLTANYTMKYSNYSTSKFSEMENKSNHNFTEFFTKFSKICVASHPSKFGKNVKKLEYHRKTKQFMKRTLLSTDSDFDYDYVDDGEHRHRHNKHGYDVSDNEEDYSEYIRDAEDSERDNEREEHIEDSLDIELEGPTGDDGIDDSVRNDDYVENDETETGARNAETEIDNRKDETETDNRNENIEDGDNQDDAQDYDEYDNGKRYTKNYDTEEDNRNDKTEVDNRNDRTGTETDKKNERESRRKSYKEEEEEEDNDDDDYPNDLDAYVNISANDRIPWEKYQTPDGPSIMELVAINARHKKRRWLGKKKLKPERDIKKKEK